jgi:hypothetical protein
MESTKLGSRKYPAGALLTAAPHLTTASRHRAITAKIGSGSAGGPAAIAAVVAPARTGITAAAPRTIARRLGVDVMTISPVGDDTSQADSEQIFL